MPAAGQVREKLKLRARAAPARAAGSWRVEHAGFPRPGAVELYHYDEEEPGEGAFRVRTLYSGISTGTELTFFRGTNPYLHACWNEELLLFEADAGAAGYPVPFSGYMQSGTVEWTRAGAVREGQGVGMAYGHKSGHTARLGTDFWVGLPEEVPPILGIYAAQMGPICANALLHAAEEAVGPAAQSLDAGVRGRCVLVLGTGVIGLLTGLMCRWAGAAEVAAAGRNRWKLGVAERLGLIPVDTQRLDAGRWAKERWGEGSARGAHVAFQCSGSDELLHLAFRAVQPQAAVIDLGFYQGGAPRLLLGREFHHNGLRHLCAQIGRVPRRLRGEWDRRRLALETIAFLRDRGKLIQEEVITHVLPFREAERAFRLLDTEGRRVLQVVLDAR